jgi:hypothetical protein
MEPGSYDQPRCRRERPQGGQSTWAGLYNTQYRVDPVSGIAGVIMMQVLPFADERALNVYRQFERRADPQQVQRLTLRIAIQKAVVSFSATGLLLP